MKRIVLALTALSLLTPAAAMAESRHGHDSHRHVEKKVIIEKKVVKPRHHRHHHWARGKVLPHEYRGDVVVYSRYHLRRPEHNRVWVRADGQFLLIDKTTGVVVATATPQ